MNGNRAKVDAKGWMGLHLSEEISRVGEAPCGRALGGKLGGGGNRNMSPRNITTEERTRGDQPPVKTGPSGDPILRRSSADPAVTRLTDIPGRRWVLRVPVWKRPLDVGVAVVLILLTLPIWILAAVLIKLTSRGPVFFTQTRLGLGMKPFPMFKFRTMWSDADSERHQKHVEQLQRQGRALEKLDEENDTRITSVGRYLRLSSVDELPQLLNVLRGEMSVVGPRPCIAYEVAAYKPWHFHRFECMPGLTGLWQVSGKNHLTADQMMRLDIRYARTQTLRGDVVIMWRTPGVIGQQVLAGYRRWRQRRSARRAPVTANMAGPVVAPPCSLSDSA